MQQTVASLKAFYNMSGKLRRSPFFGGKMTKGDEGMKKTKIVRDEIDNGRSRYAGDER